MTNEAAEGVREFIQRATRGDPDGTALWTGELEAALAAERKVTVERMVVLVRALSSACHDYEGLGCESHPCVSTVDRDEVLAILDAEAER